MAFNVRTVTVVKKDDLYIATYEVYDDVDASVAPVRFQIQGLTKAEMVTALTRKVTKLKDEYDQRSTLLAISDSVIQDLRDGEIF